MGVRADNGDILYWSTGDMVLSQNGTAKIASYGKIGSQFGWGDITGRATDENLSNYGGSTPLNEISGNANYDIARAKLGQPYRLPTYTEIERLYKNCSMEFVKIPRELGSVDENGVPSWLQGQWMWQHVIHTQRGSYGGWLSVKIDGLLVNVLSSEGKTLFEGLYNYSNGVLKFWDFTLYLDMDKKLIKDEKGEYFKKVSSQSTTTEICGYMLTSKINGNKLFFAVPSSYSAMDAGSTVIVTNNDQKVSYWSGTLYKEDSKNALALMFASNEWGIVSHRRYHYSRVRVVKGGNDSANSFQPKSTVVEKSNNKVSSSNVISPKTNSRGEYMVKTATWKTCTGVGSYKLDFEYNNSNELVKMTKRYTIDNSKVTETYTLKNDNGKYLKFVRFVNGKQNFNAKVKYNFNNKNVISNINWFAPNRNKLEQTFQIFYNENNEVIKIISKTSENMDKDWSSEIVTDINWMNGNIISDRVEYSFTEDTNDHADFIYYSKEEIINNTNLNFNFLIMFTYGREYTSDCVMGTEWFGENTKQILKGEKSELNYNYIDPKLRDHYEYEKNGDLITKLKYIAPRVSKKYDANRIYGTLTLEYVY